VGERGGRRPAARQAVRASVPCEGLFRGRARSDRAPGPRGGTPPLGALDALEAALSAGAAAAADARGQLGDLVETSAAQRRELEECRTRLATNDEARTQDLGRIAELEAELERRTKFVDDLKAKLGDVFSGLDAAN
jgi:hypothetical protein